MATTRLRRIFRYEGDDSDEDTTPWILDEEGRTAILMHNQHAEDLRLEQEKVITEIRVKDEELNNKLKVFRSTCIRHANHCCLI
jgi:hypothetical protein